MLTKIMKPIIAILRRIGIRFVIYLDDMLLMNQTKEGMIKDRDSDLDTASSGVGDELEKVNNESHSITGISGFSIRLQQHNSLLT